MRIGRGKVAPPRCSFGSPSPEKRVVAEGLGFEGEEMTGWRIGEAERVRMRKGGSVSVDDEVRWTANAVAYGRRGRRPTREKKESKMGGASHQQRE